MIDVLAIWLALFGVWPIADPSHDLSTVMSVVDRALHLAGWIVLIRRWRIVRRDS